MKHKNDIMNWSTSQFLNIISSCVMGKDSWRKRYFFIRLNTLLQFIPEMQYSVLVLVLVLVVEVLVYYAISEQDT